MGRDSQSSNDEISDLIGIQRGDDIRNALLKVHANTLERESRLTRDQAHRFRRESAGWTVF